MTISNSMIDDSPLKMPPLVEMPCDLINRIPKIEELWRGKIDEKTIQSFGYGQRCYVHIKEKVNKGKFKVCKKAVSSSGVLIARLITKFDKQDDSHKINLHRNYMDLLPHLDMSGIVKHLDHAMTLDRKGKEKITYYEEYYSDELFKYVADLKVRLLNSERCDQIAISLLKTLAAMHEKKIYHRDLKEANILIDFEKKSGCQVAICDLDSSWMEGVSSNEHLNNWFGTLAYLSPEIVLALCNKRRVEPEEFAANDVWAMGHILLLLCFQEIVPARQEILNIKCEKRRFLAVASLTKREKELFPEPMPHTKKHVIWQMLQIDPKKRISAQEALSGFLKNGEGDDKCSSIA